MEEPLGKVTIAPGVLTTIVRLTTLEQRGVSRLTPMPVKVRGWHGAGATANDGIFIAVTQEGVLVEVHLAAENGINLLKLGEAVQASIVRAIEEMVGMTVASVDVHIDEVVLQALPLEPER
jgi:uncharacterized alkaline shock family protein YloU